MLSPTEITRDKIPLQEIWKHFPNFLHLLGANLAAGLNSLLYGAVTHTGYQNQWGLCSGFVQNLVSHFILGKSSNGKSRL